MADKKDNDANGAKNGQEGGQPNTKESTVTKQEYDELKERMLRIAAEFDNYKKRTKADIDNAKGIGKAEVIKGILPVLDEFELAMMAVSNAEPTLAKGVEMVFSNLVEALAREGLKAIETDGMYDPYKHEIVLAMESDKKPGTILQVTKKGYTVNGIMIRPASVIIAAGSEAKEGIEEKDDINKNNKGE